MQVGFHQSKLPQGHFQCLGGRRTLPLVQLDRHPRAGGRVAKLMGHAGAELTERAKLFAAADLALVLAKPFRHAIDRNGQVAELVVDPSHGHRREIALRNASGLVTQPINRPHKTPGEQRGDHDDRGRGDRAGR